jgi:hypothetical protein
MSEPEDTSEELVEVKQGVVGRALAKAKDFLESVFVPSGDVADDEAIVRHLSAEEIATSPDKRALAIIRASMQASPAEQLAYGALLCIFDVDKVVVVRDDDGSVWPFVPGGARWQGAIRRRDGVVEESWFLPDEERIVWEPIDGH